jgi:signal peptidase I
MYLPARDRAGVDMALIDLAVQSLNISGRLRIKVTGTSMLPAIYPGSYASIVRTDLESVKPGDIVLVKSGCGLRLHRMIRRSFAGEEAFFVTRGDNNESDDPPVSRDEFLGMLAGLEQPTPLRRWYFAFRSWLQTPPRIWSLLLSR